MGLPRGVAAPASGSNHLVPSALHSPSPRHLFSVCVSRDRLYILVRDREIERKRKRENIQIIKSSDL